MARTEININGEVYVKLPYRLTWAQGNRPKVDFDEAEIKLAEVLDTEKDFKIHGLKAYVQEALEQHLSEKLLLKATYPSDPSITQSSAEATSSAASLAPSGASPMRTPREDQRPRKVSSKSRNRKQRACDDHKKKHKPCPDDCPKRPSNQSQGSPSVPTSNTPLPNAQAGALMKHIPVPMTDAMASSHQLQLPIQEGPPQPQPTIAHFNNGPSPPLNGMTEFNETTLAQPHFDNTYETGGYAPYAAHYVQNSVAQRPGMFLPMQGVPSGMVHQDSYESQGYISNEGQQNSADGWDRAGRMGIDVLPSFQDDYGNTNTERGVDLTKSSTFPMAKKEKVKSDGGITGLLRKLSALKVV